MLYLNPPTTWSRVSRSSPTTPTSGSSTTSRVAAPVDGPGPDHRQMLPKLQLLRFTGSGRLRRLPEFRRQPRHRPGALLEHEVQARRSARLFDVDGDVSSAPCCSRDGTVRLIALDAETPVPGAPPPRIRRRTRAATVVIKIDHPAKPVAVRRLPGDLLGVAGRGRREARQRALLGTILPVGVVYDLSSPRCARLPVQGHADWDRVQTHFEEMSQHPGALLLQRGRHGIDKLVEDQVIKIEVDNFVPAGDEQGAAHRPEEAARQVKDMVVQTSSKPTLNPADHGKDGWDRATDVATELSTLAVTGGWAGIASASYKKVDLTRIDRKLSRLQSARAHDGRRRIYPQAAPAWGSRRSCMSAATSRRTSSAASDRRGPFFRRRRVRVINRVDLQGDEVALVKASSRYGNLTKSAVLTRRRRGRAWIGRASSRAARGAAGRVRRLQGQFFNGIDTLERRAAITAPACVTPTRL